MTKTSGVITLPNEVPPRLVGSFISGIGDNEVGWIQAGFFVGDEYLRVDDDGERTRLTIRRELVAMLLGSFYILLAANRWMHRPRDMAAGSQMNGPPPDDMVNANHLNGGFTIDIDVARRGRPGLVRCWWPTGLDGVELSRIDDQINVRFRENLACELANALARELGRIAAGPNCSSDG